MNKSKKNCDCYQKVLEYFIPKYLGKEVVPTHKNSTETRRFVDEDKVRIKGIIEYKPYNIAQINKFRKFINK